MKTNFNTQNRTNRSIKKSFFLFLMVAGLFGISQTLCAQGFQWAGSIGGVSDDNANAVATDASGNVYTTGSIQSSADIDPSATSSIVTSSGSKDIFLSKVSASGKHLWSFKVGGSGFDVAESVTVDVNGNVIICGYFDGTVDFNPGAGVSTLTSVGGSDIFICMYSASGSLIWANRIGGSSGSDQAASVKADAAGNIYVTGRFYGFVDFIPGTGVLFLSSFGASDIFVLKLTSAGNFVWAKNMGGAQSDYGSAISVDASGNVITTGTFIGTADFNPGAATLNLTAKGSLNQPDIFISKLNSSGNLVWAKGIGSFDDDYGNDLALDGSGNIYIVGNFRGTVDFDPNSGIQNRTVHGNTIFPDIFVCKLTSAGNFSWADNFGDIGYDFGGSICVGLNGNVFITGIFSGVVDFNPGTATNSITSTGAVGNGFTDAFVLKLTAANQFVWVNKIGGTGNDQGTAIAVDNSENVLVAGNLSGTVNFKSTGSYIITSNGNFDGFIAKYLGSNSPLARFGESESSDKNQINTMELSMYPNPAVDFVTLKWEVQEEGVFQVVFYNAIGQVVFTKQINSVLGLNELKVETTTFPKGVYVVCFKGTNCASSSRMIVQ